MENLKNVILEKFDSINNIYSNLEKDYRYFHGVQKSIVISIRETCDFVEFCNYEVLKKLNAVKEVDLLKYEDNEQIFLVGLIVDMEASEEEIKRVDNLLAGIEDYLIVDEMAFSDKEFELQSKALKDYIEKIAPETMVSYFMYDAEIISELNLDFNIYGRYDDFYCEFDQDIVKEFVDKKVRESIRDYIIECNDPEDLMKEIMLYHDDITKKIVDDNQHEFNLNLSDIINDQSSSLSASNIHSIVKNLNQDAKNFLKMIVKEM
jgi:hypothetical protein